ncbi:putative dNA-directed DNA polymerase III epsilon subunit [Mycobacterium ulcerans str. Harvey]|uniref:DNA-directed DNA polymerase III epsilon subunit n=1 Tax=Mycobacterium ulcerans str. Harvey TaxID=1299332 RepID=A0ABN0RB12_MYCUL|nr:putative dNA-directed DNA polymerase III epsilon subunit [Mycobacterium ulcerans str. Harvey]
MTQERPHDAFDDALVLSGILAPALQRAANATFGCRFIRSPGAVANGRVTHDELRPLKALAPRCPALTSTRAATSGPAAGPGHAGSAGRRGGPEPMRSSSNGSCMPDWPTAMASTGDIAGGVQRRRP